MAGDVVVDSSVLVAHFRGDLGVTDKLKQSGAYYIPLTVVGELYFGAQRASDPATALAKLKKFLSVASVLLLDEDTARNYGEIKSGLARRGTPIPDNDIWIAAAARQRSLPIAVRDAHFRLIPDLEVLDW